MATPRTSRASRASRPSRVRLGAFVAVGLAVALALAFFVSPWASSDPDGLNRVAIDEGFADQEQRHDLDDSPLAGYGVDGVDDERFSTGLSGVIGVVVTFAVVGGALALLRRTRRQPDGGPEAADGAAPSKARSEGEPEAATEPGAPGGGAG